MRSCSHYLLSLVNVKVVVVKVYVVAVKVKENFNVEVKVENFVVVKVIEDFKTLAD